MREYIIPHAIQDISLRAYIGGNKPEESYKLTRFEVFTTTPKIRRELREKRDKEWEEKKPYLNQLVFQLETKSKALEQRAKTFLSIVQDENN